MYVTKFRDLLLSADESDTFLTIGVSSLFVGVFWIYPPAGLITIGLIFCGFSYLKELESKGADNGNA